MAENWQSLSELATGPATDDEVIVKDTSDTTDDAVGTVKRHSVANLLSSRLPLAGGTLTGALVLGGGASLDGGGKVIAHNLLSVVTGATGSLTITAHSGNACVTSGNVTIPTTTGFHC